MKDEKAFIELHEAWKRAAEAGAFGVLPGEGDQDLEVQISEEQFHKLFTTYSVSPYSESYLCAEAYPQPGLKVFILISRKDKEVEDDE